MQPAVVKISVAEFCGDLVQRPDGVWQLPSQGLVHYPAEGHASNAEIEDSSFWFRHRNACLLATLENFSPPGVVFDVGGGNGFVTRALIAAGYPAILLEPGQCGVEVAKQRQLSDVIMARFSDIPFREKSLPAVGLFDVLEHIEDDTEFLASLRAKLREGGRLYMTVPALPILWSAEDQWAEHFRRYRKAALLRRLTAAGFTVEFFSPIFGFLIAPIFCARTLPSFFGVKQHGREKYRREHTTSKLSRKVLAAFEKYEVGRIKAGRPLLSGSSYLVVAKA